PVASSPIVYAVKTATADTELATSTIRKAEPTPNLLVSTPCRAAIGHAVSASTMKNSGYACGPALFKKIDWAALNAVYMAQPTTIAKPATCSVRRSSVRRTWRTLARRGATGSCRANLGLLDAGAPLQGGNALCGRLARGGPGGA